MTFQVCILGSGSSGNCTYVGTADTGVLIDAGLSGRETVRRLEQIGIAPRRIRGVCVSHEHNDHIAGLRVLNRRHGIPLYANAGTVQGLSREESLADLPWNIFTTGNPLTIGDLTIEPFSVPHDAFDPVGFVVGAGAIRAGIVTDIGVPTTLVRQRLSQCSVVVVESNHDERMLQEAERPWYLKQRIMGRQGHLSNDRAATMIAEIAGPALRHVFLAHLSEDCNREDLAVRVMRERLSECGHAHISVSASFPDRVSEVWQPA